MVLSGVCADVGISGMAVLRETHGYVVDNPGAAGVESLVLLLYDVRGGIGVKDKRQKTKDRKTERRKR